MSRARGLAEHQPKQPGRPRARRTTGHKQADAAGNAPSLTASTQPFTAVQGEPTEGVSFTLVEGREAPDPTSVGTPEQQAAFQQWQDHQDRQRFLVCYQHLGVIGPAAEAAGIHRDTVNYWRKHDSAFEQAFQSTTTALTDDLELKGLVAISQAKPEQLLQHPNMYFFHMKKRRPEFRDGASITIDARQQTVNVLSPEQARRVAAALAGLDPGEPVP